MAISLIVHIMNEEPVMGEVEEVPNLSDQFVIMNNPRTRDGKDLIYLEDEVTKMIVPWHRINFIEIIPSGEAEDIITFVRE